MEELKFRLESFEGPLDLLLNLISKNKVSITDIPISLIFDQYMEYLGEMRKMDMEIAGEFIVMASELMLIKSRILLPKTDEPEEDPRLSLSAALLEYQKIKMAAEYFGELYGEYSGRFAKETTEPEAETALGEHNASMLTRAFNRIYDRAGEKELEAAEPRRMTDELVKRHIVPISAKIYGIIRYLYKNGSCDFDTLMLTSRSRSELVASFFALLELLRSGRVLLDERDEGIILTLNREKSVKDRREKKSDEDEASGQPDVY